MSQPGQVYEVSVNRERCLAGITFVGKPPKPVRIKDLDVSASEVRDVSVGDVLLAINGSDVQSMDRWEMVGALRAAPVRLKLLRKKAARGTSVPDTLVGSCSAKRAAEVEHRGGGLCALLAEERTGEVDGCGSTGQQSTKRPLEVEDGGFVGVRTREPVGGPVAAVEDRSGPFAAEVQRGSSTDLREIPHREVKEASAGMRGTDRADEGGGSGILMEPPAAKINGGPTDLHSTSHREIGGCSSTRFPATSGTAENERNSSACMHGAEPDVEVERVCSQSLIPPKNHRAGNVRRGMRLFNLLEEKPESAHSNAVRGHRLFAVLEASLQCAASDRGVGPPERSPAELALRTHEPESRIQQVAPAWARPCSRERSCTEVRAAQDAQVLPSFARGPSVRGGPLPWQQELFRLQSQLASALDLP